MAEKEYIEREAAICAIDRRTQQLMKDPEFRRKRGYIDIYGVRRMISEIPAADVRPVVRGKWEVKSFHKITCSKCGMDIDIMKVDDNLLLSINYCPSCGADMRPIGDENV